MLQPIASAALAAPIAPCPDITMPFPAWVPSEADHRYSDQLAWFADSPDNGFDDYPGEGWDDVADDAPFEPTADDIAELNGGVPVGYLSPDEQDALLDWLDWSAARDADLAETMAELHSPIARIHSAELAEIGLDPWGHRLPAAVAQDCYAGGDWR